jgi:two-component system sensor histidine kinase QseC
MISIRRFLVIVILATITLFNFVAALQSYRTSIKNAEALFDEQLQDMATLLSHADFNSIVDIQPSRNNMFFQIWHDKTHLLQKTSNAPNTAIVSFDKGYHHATFADYRWRILVQEDINKEHTIIIAERADIRYMMAESIALQSILPNIIALPLLVFFIWFIVGHGLKPLRDLANALSEKKHNDLSPLHLDNIPLELKQVFDSSNDLLQRLESSFAREKRFSGDAAHELRTPLSALKIHLYNLSKIIPSDNENIRQVNESINRMTHLIEQMLALYRTTPEQFLAKFTDVDIYKLAQELITDRYQSIADKNQHIELIGSPCTMTGDYFALYTLLKNLVDNANKYTPEGGSIIISITPTQNIIELCVEDSGVGVPEEFFSRVFERFYRMNGDQHNSMTVGCGLGLSIVQHIVDLHGGSITLTPSQFSTGLKVTVSLPIQQITNAKGI